LVDKRPSAVVIYDKESGLPLVPGATGSIWLPDNGRDRPTVIMDR
jgi:hypothetical protein